MVNIFDIIILKKKNKKNKNKKQYEDLKYRYD
jgi:hypothetical protein